MRLILDTLIALMLVAILGLVLTQQRAQADELHHVQLTRYALQQLHTQALYYGSLQEIPNTALGYPIRIEKTWFDSTPANPLADPASPWIDVASEDQRELANPDHILADEHNAAFWYNPYKGVFRARIAQQPTDRQTLDLYNLVNNTALTTINR
jgi:type II secretory pathway pseudopilin PulG